MLTRSSLSSACVALFVLLALPAAVRADALVGPLPCEEDEPGDACRYNGKRGKCLRVSHGDDYLECIPLADVATHETMLKDEAAKAEAAKAEAAKAEAAKAEAAKAEAAKAEAAKADAAKADAAKADAAKALAKTDATPAKTEPPKADTIPPTKVAGDASEGASKGCANARIAEPSMLGSFALGLLLLGVAMRRRDR
jgi:hypothetical protein